MADFFVKIYCDPDALENNFRHEILEALMNRTAAFYTYNEQEIRHYLLQWAEQLADNAGEHINEAAQ